MNFRRFTIGLALATLVVGRGGLATAADITGMHYSACCNLNLGLLGLSG